tara:strand:+ start:110726 stop:111052 length:327 start_codon:yes stop_codon:yes gene_type:complete
MKTLKTVFVALSILITSSAFAATTGTPETVTKEITALLDHPSFLVTQESTVMVEFILNRDNEVVVLSVDCDDAAVRNFINERLDRKVLDSKLQQGKVFTLPVKFMSKD